MNNFDWKPKERKEMIIIGKNPPSSVVPILSCIRTNTKTRRVFDSDSNILKLCCVKGLLYYFFKYRCDFFITLRKLKIFFLFFTKKYFNSYDY